ncbi:MAG: hypothetical protein EOP00_17385 [Pedobacter sp.]|nr:MAG: hypothetical protein EOP00_17385 [Pedobacter sp.]
MLQELLKTQTAPLHDQLEQIMYVKDIMQRKLTLAQYKKLLITNYLIHTAYEEKIFDQIDSEIANHLNFTKRNKVDALTTDLKQANLNKTDYHHLIENVATIPNSAFAMGALYVLEGATLGGSVIVKQLQQNPNFNTDFKFSYYGVYGKDLIANWQAFVKELNNLPAHTYDEAIAGANFMFDEITRIAVEVNGLEA